MYSYLVRVELHGARQESDYQTLHIAMAAAGFSRSIVASNGAKLQLPTAEYFVSTTQNINAVLEAAKGAAASTRKTFEVVVGNISEWSAYNLPPIRS